MTSRRCIFLGFFKSANEPAFFTLQFCNDGEVPAAHALLEPVNESAVGPMILLNSGIVIVYNILHCLNRNPAFPAAFYCLRRNMKFRNWFQTADSAVPPLYAIRVALVATKSTAFREESVNALVPGTDAAGLVENTRLRESARMKANMGNGIGQGVFASRVHRRPVSLPALSK
jgi:hypothetical protein